MLKNIIEQAKSYLLWLGYLVTAALAVYVCLESYSYAQEPKVYVGNFIALAFNYVPLLIVVLLIWWRRKLNYSHLLLFGIIFFGWAVGPITLIWIAIKGIDDFVLHYPLHGPGGASYIKSCSRCHKVVDIRSHSGQNCPHCGAFWSYETGASYRQ